MIENSAASMQPAPGDPPPGLALEPIRVLAVDDETRNLEVLQLALTAPEFNLQVCDDSEAALELAHRHRPHVILLDVVMPGLDGLALCRQIKADVELGYVPVVLVTYVFGPRLPAFGRCITTKKELQAIAKRSGSFSAYVVEVCPECHWHFRRRSYVLGDGVPRPARRARKNDTV